MFLRCLWWFFVLAAWGCQVSVLETEFPGQSKSLSEPNNGTEETCYPQVLKLKGNVTCSGVLIDTNKVLTAAHCKEIHSVVHNNQTINVSAKHVHPKSSFQCTPNFSSIVFAHDLSILELETPITDINPVKFGNAKAMELGRVVGFGRTSESDDSALETKRSYVAPINEVLEDGKVLRHSTVNGVGGCYGDSGGGLFRKDTDCNEPVLLGITSFKIGACGNGDVGFANMAHTDNVNFIKDILHNKPVSEWTKMSEMPECCEEGEAPSCFDETQLGACRFGKVQCLPNTGRFGRCLPAKPKAELCGNTIDDDCDGATDEGCYGFSPLGSAEVCGAPCSIYEPLLCRPFSLEAGGYRCDCQGKRVCAPDEICSVASSTCEPKGASGTPQVCGCIAPGTPQQRCRVDYNDALPPCATKGNDCALLCAISPLSADVLPPPPPPSSGGSSACTLDGLCSQDEKCECDIFCCQNSNRPCTWNGGAFISYEDCYACGFRSDGEVCWLDGIAE